MKYLKRELENFRLEVNCPKCKKRCHKDFNELPSIDRPKVEDMIMCPDCGQEIDIDMEWVDGEPECISIMLSYVDSNNDEKEIKIFSIPDGELFDAPLDVNEKIYHKYYLLNRQEYKIACAYHQNEKDDAEMVLRKTNASFDKLEEDLDSPVSISDAITWKDKAVKELSEQGTLSYPVQNYVDKGLNI